MRQVARGQKTTDDLTTWIESFLIDRKAQNVARGTMRFYRVKLELFAEYCSPQGISQIEQITPTVIRDYMIALGQKGHNPGGVFACYRALKTFLHWYWAEVEPEGKNPISTIKTPKVPLDNLDPVALEDVSALVATCGKDFYGARDKAMLLTLLDTGVRAQELCDIDLADVNIPMGAILIRKGKGRKPRTVFIGSKTRRAVRAWLKHRGEKAGALWKTIEGDRLTYWGLRLVVLRRSKQAGIKTPSLHSFRRSFAINMLRAGVDIYSLRELMGHADLAILRLYLKLTESDLAAAHARGSPVDKEL